MSAFQEAIRRIKARNGSGEISYIVENIEDFWNIPGAEEYYENADSFRIAEVGNVEDEKEFDIQRTCCGSKEVVFGPSPEGKNYLWGFNYGH